LAKAKSLEVGAEASVSVLVKLGERMTTSLSLIYVTGSIWHACWHPTATSVLAINNGEKNHRLGPDLAGPGNFSIGDFESVAGLAIQLGSGAAEPAFPISEQS
jgi:hypothetical protein